MLTCKKNGGGGGEKRGRNSVKPEGSWDPIDYAQPDSELVFN